MVQRIQLYANDPNVDTQCYKTTVWRRLIKLKPKLTATSIPFHLTMVSSYKFFTNLSFLWNHRWLPTNCSPPTGRLQWRGCWSLEIDTQKSGKAKNKITLSPISMEVQNRALEDEFSLPKWSVSASMITGEGENLWKTYRFLTHFLSPTQCSTLPPHKIRLSQLHGANCWHLRLAICGEGAQRQTQLAGSEHVQLRGSIGQGKH